jgi:nucleotidyltransferase substrate binding protein (TIGR01987 family)
MIDADIRWKQRFQNFEKAILLFENGLAIKNPSLTELAWKLLKDYQEAQGVQELNFPRQIIKEAFQSNLISNGHIWLEALTDRNLTSHTYDEVLANELVLTLEQKYYPLLADLYKKFKLLI